MITRLLGAMDARAYQNLRLLALGENPCAFSASLEEETGRSLDEVAARLRPALDGSVCTLGIHEGNELSGFLAIIHPQRAKLRHCVEFAGMVVARSSRRRGVGRRLLEAAIEHVRAIDGVRQIKLSANDANTAAKALYRSVGFTSWGTEPDALNIEGTFCDETHYVLWLSSND